MKIKSFFYSTCLVLIASVGILLLSSTTGAQQKASVKTNAITNITSTTAQGSYVISVSGITVTKHGLCLSKGPAPTTKNTIFSADKGAGPGFNVQITGLAPGMKFYARSFITTATETIYGNEVSFTTLAAKK